MKRRGVAITRHSIAGVAINDFVCHHYGRSLPENAPRVFVSQFARDAFVREADKLSKWRVRSARATRQRRDEATDRRPWMAIERSKIATACVVRHAGQHTHRNQCRALSAQPIVGENSIGMRLACRSFHAETRRPASSSTCASVARLAAASFSAACRRRSSILRRLKPMAGGSQVLTTTRGQTGCESSLARFRREGPIWAKNNNFGDSH